MSLINIDFKHKKMKMRTFVLLIALLTVGTTYSQFDCTAFYPFEEGATMEYANYNHKDKLEGTQTTTVKSVKEVDGAVEAVVYSSIRDKKEKEQFTGEYTIRCENGTLKMDVSSMLNPAMQQSFSGMEMTIEGDALQLPNELKVGMELPDATTTIKAGTGSINIVNMTVNITDRKVEGKETITTEAGTFECFKVRQTTNVKMMISKSFDSVEYYAENVGVVRSETYDKKGNLESYMVLTKFEK